MKKYIVFITDCVDIAYNELRGVILSMIGIRDDIVVEPVVPVVPFSIINGNFVLRLMAENYPPGTIFSVILNPVRKRPERLIGKTKKKKFIFAGANTGVFTWLLRDFGCEEIYEMYDPGFFPFGGKYVHAPVVAKAALGVPLKNLGKPFPFKKVAKLKIKRGTIVHIDNFGLMKFYDKLPPGLKEGDEVKLKLNNTLIRAVYGKRMMDFEDGEWVLYPGSSLGLPELGKVREIPRELNVKVGDRIIIQEIIKKH
jgi:S-adenosylmethionine hydrolase